MQDNSKWVEFNQQEGHDGPTLLTRDTLTMLFCQA